MISKDSEWLARLFGSKEIPLTAEYLNQLELIGEGSSAKIFRIPEENKVLKLFPLLKQPKDLKEPKRPLELNFLADKKRLATLLGMLKKAQVPLLQDTEVVTVKSTQYFPKAVKMVDLSNQIQKIDPDVDNNNEEICNACVRLIAMLHAQGIVLDHSNDNYSGHGERQLYAIFRKINEQVIVFDWTNLSHFDWNQDYGSRDYQSKWIHQITYDLDSKQGFRLFLEKEAGRYLEKYKEVFTEICKDKKMVNKLFQEIEEYFTNL